jgi:hypothetical protein
MALRHGGSFGRRSAAALALTATLVAAAGRADEKVGPPSRPTA